MDQNHGTAGAFDYEVKIRALDGYKFRDGLRMIVSNAGGDVCLLESAGNVHDNNLFTQRRKDAKAPSSNLSPQRRLHPVVTTTRSGGFALTPGYSM